MTGFRGNVSRFMQTLAFSETSPISFEIHPMSWVEQERQARNEAPHRHEYYVVIGVTAGTGTHDVDFQRYDVQPGTWWFLSPGQAHHLAMDGPHEGWVLSFGADFFGVSETSREVLVNSGLFNNLLNFKPFSLQTPAAVWRLESPLRAMQEEFERPEAPLHADLLRSWLGVFLVEAARAFAQQLDGPQETSRTVCLVRQFQDLIEREYQHHPKVADYAAKLGITPSHLNDTVKKVTGQPASEHIKQRIIVEAKRRAFYGHATAKEIAYALGFDDEAHFSKYFKTNTGQTFSAYRKTLQSRYA